MSFGSRLVHTVTHVRTPLDEGDLDDYGQPTAGAPVETEIRGLVQPRSVREIVDSRSAGAEIGDHVIFLQPMSLQPTDAFVYDGDRYEIKGIREFSFGRSPHLEVDVRRVGATTVEV